MKLPYSMFSRRSFLNGLLAGLGTALAGTFIGPVIRFVFPPYKEPDEVRLAFVDYKDMKPGEIKGFAWGIKPGFLKLQENGAYLPLVGVCSHLDCNVAYLPDQKRFFCACHDGWYDENGLAIKGPPPAPLRRLAAAVEGEEIIIRKAQG